MPGKKARRKGQGTYTPPPEVLARREARAEFNADLDIQIHRMATFLGIDDPYEDYVGSTRIRFDQLAQLEREKIAAMFSEARISNEISEDDLASRHDEAIVDGLAEATLDIRFEDNCTNLAALNNETGGWFRDRHEEGVAPHDRASIKKAIKYNLTGKGGSKFKLIGAYFTNRTTGFTSFVGIDIDSHDKKNARTGEVIPGSPCEDQLSRAIQILRAADLDFLIDRSKGGKGYHLLVKLPRETLFTAAQRIGKAILAMSGLSPMTEIFPKDTATSAARLSPIGTQIGLPGSLFFQQKTGGSVYHDPKTLLQLPVSRWSEMLRSVREPSVEKIKSIFGDQIFDEVKVEPKASPSESKPVIAVGAPRFKTFDSLIQFLEDNKLEPLRVVEDSSKIILRECPNVENHGSPGGDTGCVFYDSDTERVGFNCKHASCDKDFSWWNVLEKLGYRPRRSDENQEWVVPDYAVKAPHHIPDLDPKEGEPIYLDEATAQAWIKADIDERRTNRKDRAFSKNVKASMRESLVRTEVRGSKSIFQIVRFLEGLFYCAESTSTGYCDGNPSRGIFGHGRVTGDRPHTCKKRACPICVHTLWSFIEEYIIDRWPDAAHVACVECKPGAYSETHEKIARKYRTHKSHRKHLGRHSKGYSRITYVTAIDSAHWAKRRVGEGAIMTKDEYIKILREDFFSFSEKLKEVVVTAHEADRDIVTAVLPLYPFLKRGFNQTSCTDAQRSIFPLPTQEEEKEMRAARREEKYPGLPMNCCPSVVAFDDEGDKIFCGCNIRNEIKHKRTGDILGSYKGWDGRALKKKANARTNEYFDAVIEDLKWEKRDNEHRDFHERYADALLEIVPP